MVRSPDDVDRPEDAFPDYYPDQVRSELSGPGEDCLAYSELSDLGCGARVPTPEESEHLASCRSCRTAVAVCVCGKPVLGHPLLSEHRWEDGRLHVPEWSEFLEALRRQALPVAEGRAPRSSFAILPSAEGTGIIMFKGAHRPSVRVAEAEAPGRAAPRTRGSKIRLWGMAAAVAIVVAGLPFAYDQWDKAAHAAEIPEWFFEAQELILSDIPQ